ncbi:MULTISPECIES: Crp/Fnr family transcriptional regulator [Chryseobacterium]|uniref:CRP-like cAMP-binding protein n=1 Tax=Chryseobacterium camelliae TaxID=1265445 RepID=A0ABU0TGT7_9FLAO|nr:MULTISPECIES: Crp/Fnr family transcriptional regulator [Chryseobacterium]MDT3405929.1 CRP-like cAMP-binding protein [Pseudacidovorax intermedius]MDQ1096267.1 CRP-like cAMP-binding protein [Chryseobacterium camelliae]MDQ1100204.1 CRP-like cAMP-binding protein [Chryseobacterium sp. SORGH_AS_1048]MDR6087549.1 CRP-like cAMP-binding protein [Chryseobacterium sp. SORGH_AS_0909]MDR6131923.1 CRP-like cAMP-binding protein [Chryseobacterium sp. SORGH_AS_1175]
MVIQEEILYSMGATAKDYTPSEFIFNEGEQPHYYYQIVSGEVKLNNYSEDGKEFIQDILSAGQSCGESILFIDKPYPMNAETITDCRVIRLKKSSFFSLLDRSPKLCMEISNVISQGLYHKFIMMQNISSQNPTTRLKGLMDYLKSFESNKKPYSFMVPLTRKQMASLTGLCVETAIRTIKAMEKNKILKIQDRKILY